MSVLTIKKGPCPLHVLGFPLAHRPMCSEVCRYSQEWWHGTSCRLTEVVLTAEPGHMSCTPLKKEQLIQGWSLSCLFFYFLSLFDVCSLKMPLSCEEDSVTHLCMERSSFQSLFKALVLSFPLGRVSASAADRFAWGRLTAVPPAVRRWHGGLRAPTAPTVPWSRQMGSSSKSLAAFSTVSHQDKSPPCFFSPGKVAETRVTFNNPTWQVDKKVRLKIKNKSTIPSIPKGGGGAA